MRCAGPTSFTGLHVGERSREILEGLGYKAGDVD